MQRLVAQMFHMKPAAFRKKPRSKYFYLDVPPLRPQLIKNAVELEVHLPNYLNSTSGSYYHLPLSSVFFSCLLDGEANSESSRLICLSKQATLDVSFLLSDKISTPNGL